MPQESMRSVVYRSFVTCDDPKGVVECKTIRKSKKIEDKTQNQRKTHSNTCTASEEARKDKELQKLPNSFEIMEVSRGAQKLNQVVDSLSNRPSVDDQSKYIAKDLLRGALDLQESLVMLSKLQQASKRHKEKPVGGREGTEFMDSNPFGYDDRCYDELREVIKESFARQNLLPKVSAKEKDCFERKNSESLCLDIPSSSSSQSSLICSHSSNCSPSSVQVQHEKTKGRTNLIAKLMGLEEVPSKGANSMAFKQMEKEKFLKQRSHLLDIDLPRPKKKPQFMVQKVVQERRTLEEIIETMQFKGVVGIKSIDDEYRSDDVSLLRKSLAVEGPPIVIMRPRHVPHHRAKELHENHSINEEKHIKSRARSQNMRERFPPCAVEVPRGRLKFIAIDEKLAARRPPKQNLNKDKEDKHSGKFPVKKTLDNQDRVSSTMKINYCKPLVPRTGRKEAVVRNIDDKPKVVPKTRKQVETKEAKFQGSERTQDLGKHTTLKLSKAVRESNVSKSQVARGKVEPPDENIKRTSLKSSVPKQNLRKGKPNSKPSAALVENVQSDDYLPINIESNSQGLLMKGAESEQITEEVMNASCTSMSDNSGNAASSPCEPTSKGDLSGIEDGSCIPCRYLVEAKGRESITNTRYLLLSSVSFLNHVEELFDTGTCEPTIFPTDCLPDSEVVLDDSLLLDCAKEILDRKSFGYTRMINPFSQKLLRKPKCNVYIQELVGEISDGIEHLRNYSKSCGEIVLLDSIYSMLERDLRWNEEVTGAWDLGWRNGYTTEAVNEVVHDIEKLVLSEFVADVVIEFMPR